ncbi:GNAT family N-acetyltransferase [Sinorhizobium sp. 8-89]|uniref:GNAT family N-acetyltransferase n=1 Tax=Sinorhizobium sp. 7-81 TaxID=3049087 RepID=UPI0024C3082C|nr:GNAT family N-acetyltransferase [Sinorhizobium sp. 7-81]MDK1384825.1 GNAT family N-acetyltransferase [Sinorhizobium sp. 7-81]
MRIGDINNADLEQLHALSIAVGWPHRAEDWQFAREVGNGIVALDEIDRIQGSAMWFPYGAHFATIGLVITTPRLQANGAAKWLMGHVLDRVGGRNLGLNATRAARRLYRSLNFSTEALVFQCQGESTLPPDVQSSSGTVLRALAPTDLQAIAELDSGAFGADRKMLLARLLACSESVGLIRDGKIEGFSLCRRFGRGRVIGPVVAANDADAIAVVRPHVAKHAGSFLRLDTREQGGAFSDFLAHCGLPVYDTVTTMSRGRPWLIGPGRQAPRVPRTYALVGHALG